MLNAIIGWEYTRPMSSTSAWKRLAIHVIDFKGFFALGLTAMIVVIAVLLAGPLMLGSIIDDSIPKGIDRKSTRLNSSH